MKKNVYELREYGYTNKRVVYLIGGWGMPQWMLLPVSKLLEAAGLYCITISLGKDILSPDMGKSIHSIFTVKGLIMRSIRRLAKTGHYQFSIFGTSLGALIGLLVANSSPLIRKVIFNMPGMDFAESLWQWDGDLLKFRTELTLKYHTYEEFRAVVSPINTINHLNKLHGKDLLFYLSTTDKIALSDPSLLESSLQSHNYRFRILINNSFGHFIAGFINLVNAPVYLSFLS